MARKNEDMKPAPPAHSNVYWGPKAMAGIKKDGGRCSGVIHHFNMEWGCGHTGSAVEVHVPRVGCVKACVPCAKEAGLPGSSNL